MAYNFSTRTPLFSRHQIGGTFAIVDESKSTGNQWFVNSATGTDAAGNGFNPDKPFKTIGYAVATGATASQGDRVYVMPGHTETLTTAAAWVPVAGVSVYGIGAGDVRPTITFSATAAQVTVTNANVHFENLIFDGTGIDAVVSPFSVSAASCEFVNCRCITGKSSFHTGVFITTTAGANRLLIQGCQFLGDATANTTNVLQLIGGDGIRIIDNEFYGNYTTTLGAINNITTGITNLTVERNRINNGTASSTKCIVMLNNTTGFVSNNRLAILSGTAPITAAAMFWSGNYYSNTAGQVSTLV